MTSYTLRVYRAALVRPPLCAFELQKVFESDTDTLPEAPCKDCVVDIEDNHTHQHRIVSLNAPLCRALDLRNSLIGIPPYIENSERRTTFAIEYPQGVEEFLPPADDPDLDWYLLTSSIRMQYLRQLGAHFDNLEEMHAHHYGPAAYIAWCLCKQHGYRLVRNTIQHVTSYESLFH